MKPRSSSADASGSPLPEPRFLAAGDCALVVEFGEVIDPRLIGAVQSLDRSLAEARLEGVIETVPTFRSLMVHYDPLVVRRAKLIEAIGGLAAGAAAAAAPARRWALPACYEGELAPDLDQVAEATGLEASEVVSMHASTEFTVAVLGFLPGCPFLSGLPDVFDLPRRQEPRTRLPGGSVAVAQKLSVIYPTDSPGGWHLIGNCPLRLFDPRHEPPALLVPGDTLRFRPVGRAEHRSILEAVAAERFDAHRECLQP